MHILLIEDDKMLGDYTARALMDSGHTVERAANGKDGLRMAKAEAYDLFIIDRMMPEMDGLTLIKTLRDAGDVTPTLILSSLGEVNDRVTGLRSGGDDYLVKPFAFAELLARAEILAARRTRNDPSPAGAMLSIGDLEMDLLSRKVKRAGVVIALQSREFRLLEYLMRNKGHVVTRTMLLEAVWDYHFDPQTNVIDVHVSRLRRKIDKGAAKPLIKTVRGAGYLIDDED